MNICSWSVNVLIPDIHILKPATGKVHDNKTCIQKKANHKQDPFDMPFFSDSRR
jgi:hypothetical protein